MNLIITLLTEIATGFFFQRKADATRRHSFVKLLKRIISTDYVDLIPDIEVDNPSPLEGGHPRRGPKCI